MKLIVSVWGGADGFDYLASFVTSEEDAIEIAREELRNGNRLTLNLAEGNIDRFVFDRRLTLH